MLGWRWTVPAHGPLSSTALSHHTAITRPRKGTMWCSTTVSACPPAHAANSVAESVLARSFPNRLGRGVA